MDGDSNHSGFFEFVSDSAESFVFCDSEGKVTHWNKGSEYLFGYTSDDIKKYSVFSLADRSSFESFSILFEAAKKGRTFSFETRCLTREGAPIDAEVTMGLLKEKDWVYCIFKDVSRIRKIQDKLDNIAMFPDNNPDMIMIWDRFEGVTYQNPSVKNFFQELGILEYEVEDILPPRFEKYLRKLAGSEKKLKDVEVEFQGKTLSYTFSPFQGDENRILIIGKDITDLAGRPDDGFSLENTKNMLGFFEKTLKELSFSALEETLDFKTVANVMIRDMGDSESADPTHLMIAVENRERQYEGWMIYKKHGIIQMNNIPMIFNPLDFKRIIPSSGEALFVNRSDEESGVEEFQERFPENFREFLPDISNYVSCQAEGDPGVLVIAVNYRKSVGPYDGATIKGVTMSVSTMLALQGQQKYKEEAQFITMTKVAEWSEKRDGESIDHLNRVRNYARIIAEEMASTDKYRWIITRDFIKKLYHSAALHDIGKIGVPEEILQKPGKLDTKEYEVMREHTLIGGKILGGPKTLEMAREIAYYHHEKFDGSGYPYGVKNEEIPLAARIVAIADVYDAMTTKRAYKEAFSHDRTKKLISICSGGHFDPDVVEAFLAREQDFVRIKEMYKDS